MLKKIALFFRIKKFYNIFGEFVGDNFITKLSHMTYDDLNDVIYDINEVLCDYEDDETNEMCRWLTKLCDEIAWFRNRMEVR